jgi:mono/diheme cytochrome c family protein
MLTNRRRPARARGATLGAVAKRKATSRPREAPKPAAPEPAPGGGSFLSRFGFAILAVLVVGGAAAYGVVQGNREKDRGVADTTAEQTTQAPFRSNREATKGQPAKEQFAHTCGTCHTLRRAGVQGIIGPDLDKVVLTQREARAMIRTGSLDTVMPKDLLVGEDADRVARYVAEQSLASRRARAKR